MTRVWILTVLLLLCVSGGAHAQDAEPDNRYCRPGNAPQFGANDGPATLPQSCFYTATVATPSPGKVIRVPAGSDLQGAINKAHCGETLELTHRAHTRDCYARGALQAAKFLAGRPPGRYTMNDVLGL